MATEVSCGQCQGRLLVETLGVVVACPHCGTHLSIPAPQSNPAAVPEPPPPAPIPEPPAMEFAAPPAPVPVLDPAPVEAPAVLPEPVGTLTSPAVESVATTPEEPQPSNVFAGIDDATTAAAIGWHSAPNLHLTPDPAAAADPAQLPPVTFTPPLLEPFAPPAAMESFAPPLPAEAVVQMPLVMEAELQLPSSQQFSLGATNDAAKSTPQIPEPVFAAAPPSSATPPVTFGAAPAVASSPPPLTFGAAPAAVLASAPQPLTFAAAAGAPAAKPSPITFGAAPASAPVTFGAAPAVDVSATVAEEAAAFAASELVQRQKFLFVLLVVIGSYASCVTIVLAYLLIRGQSSNLESLPDLLPPRGENGQIGAVYNPPKNDVALGHVLKLGQARRFGNVKVTPLKVTRGPVKFEHFSGEPGMTREPTPPILKLWVKFENVSRNQTFAPVDPYLLFSRKSSGLSGPVQANSFVATLANQRKGKPVSHIYEMSKESEFRMVGQNLNVDLEPGEKLETFFPAEEDASELSGDLVWRFQFRKGYNPTSKRGVTTLIDVRFKSSDIQEERGA